MDYSIPGLLFPDVIMTVLVICQYRIFVETLNSDQLEGIQIFAALIS
jgi:hypothetical protein